MRIITPETLVASLIYGYGSDVEMLKNKNLRASVGAIGGLTMLGAGMYRALQICGAEMEAILADTEVPNNLPYGERNALLLSAVTCLTIGIRQRMGYISDQEACRKTTPVIAEDNVSKDLLPPSQVVPATVSLVKNPIEHEDSSDGATVIDIGPFLAAKQQPPGPHYPDGSGGLSSAA